MARIIAVVNQKGGVGKTTTTVNLSAALHDAGKRVLLCDFDPQANATSGMGVDKNTASPNVYDVLINGAEPERAVQHTKYGDVLPSNKALAGAGIEMIGIADRENLLKQALGALSDQYDYIFIDCPPSLELLTVNALCAADSLLVPVQCEYYALEGLSDLLATGYDAYGNGKGYPYVLVSPVQPEAGKTYQVAICGVSDQLAAETTVTDSGVVGMDAAKAFFGAYTTISRADTAWS